MTYKLVLALLGIFVVAPTVLFFATRWIVWRSFRLHPMPRLSYTITPAGFVLYGLLTVVLVLGAASSRLEPNGPVGSWLQRPSGMFIGSLVLAICFSGAERILRRLGYPAIRDRNATSKDQSPQP